jgi:hypothetical protein
MFQGDEETGMDLRQKSLLGSHHKKVVFLRLQYYSSKMKQATTLDEQISLLRSRGIQITNEEKA